MTLNTFNSYQDQKGQYAERLVREYLEREGWIFYPPATRGRPHPFDFLVAKKIGQRYELIAGDVKAKARLNIMNATGVSLRHYETYDRVSREYGMPFWLIFVDEGVGQIYGALLDQLEEEMDREGHRFPLVLKDKDGGKERYWHRDSMEHIRHLTGAEIDKLKSYNTRTHELKVPREVVESNGFHEITFLEHIPAMPTDQPSLLESEKAI